LEALEERVVPDADYWQPPGNPPPPSAAWNVDADWSLLRAPRTADDAIFDANHSTVPCIASGTTLISPQSITFAANLPSDRYMLTVANNSMLGTATLTLNARSASGNEILIQQGANLNVTALGQGFASFMV
jgi:hypothetical protein